MKERKIRIQKPRKVSSRECLTIQRTVAVAASTPSTATPTASTASTASTANTHDDHANNAGLATCLDHALRDDHVNHGCHNHGDSVCFVGRSIFK